MRSYEAARGLLSFLGFLAWCAIIGGILVAIGAGSAVSQTRSFGVGGSEIAAMMAAMPGLILAFLGFLALAQVQIGRAGVDTAEYTQQMLKIARDQLDVSKQSLKQGGAPKQSFETLQLETPLPDGPKNGATYEQGLHSKKDPPITASPVHLEKTVGTSIEYGSEQIEETENGYIFAGETFPTLEAAKAKIDGLVADKVFRAVRGNPLGPDPLVAARSLRRR